MFGRSKKYLNYCNNYRLSEKYITMLYEQCPLAVKALMDRSFCEDKRALTDNEMEDALLVDYGLVQILTHPFPNLLRTNINLCEETNTFMS